MSPSHPAPNPPAANPPNGGGRTVTVTAGAEQSGRRADLVLAAGSGLSRSRIKALILDGRVSTGGETISDPDLGVKPGQTFAIFVPDAVPARPQGQNIPLSVVYEDEDLIVIDKPAGLVVHPAPGNPDLTLVNALIAHCGDSLSGIGGERRPGIVHRLDKDTSGLMVAAKSDRAHGPLAAGFKARTIERAYTAFVWGAPGAGDNWPEAGEIDGPIGRSPRNRKKMAVLGRGGRKAVTRYRTVARYGEEAGGANKGRKGGMGGKGGKTVASRLECRLLTGRTHQIRVHLAHIGHPVIGDPVYGGSRGSVRGASGGGRLEEFGRVAGALGRQALHAYLIGFEHPVSGAPLRFESPLPKDIKELQVSLESI